MLKISAPSDSILKMLKIDDNKVVENSYRVNKTFKNLSKFKKSQNKKSKNLMHIKTVKKSIFLTFGAKKAFNHL